MRPLRISVALAIAVAAIGVGLRPTIHAQSLTTGLFSRYLDALRQEVGIPGLSAALVQNGSVVWASGFGHADVASNVAARADTPYPILNLSESFGSVVVLQQCVEFGSAELTDRVERWTPFEDRSTLLQVLAHTTLSNSYQYSATRFGTLSDAVRECVKEAYPRVLATRVLDFAAMRDSVPGREAVTTNASLFSAQALDQYRSVVARTATPYRVSNRTATRSDYTPAPLTASTGVISTVLDLAKFDAALEDGLLSRELLEQAWQTDGGSRPTGLGWFVQPRNGERIVWHFGVAPNAYSSLVVKLPARRLTFILLANSDGLGTGLNTAQPSVTQSLFAQLFLQQVFP